MLRFLPAINDHGDLLDARGRTRHSRGHCSMLSLISPNEARRCVEQGGQSSHSGCQIHLQTPKPYSISTLTGLTSTRTYAIYSGKFSAADSELNVLRMIPGISAPRVGRSVEFHVWLQQREVQFLQMTGRPAPESFAETVLETKNRSRKLNFRRPLHHRTTIDTAEIALPSISAVIPLYNGSKFIEAALQSVFDKRYRRTKSSSLTTARRPGQPGQGDVRALSDRLLSRPNGGQSSARNFGVAQTSVS